MSTSFYLPHTQEALFEPLKDELPSERLSRVVRLASDNQRAIEDYLKRLNNVTPPQATGTSQTPWRFLYSGRYETSSAKFGGTTTVTLTQNQIYAAPFFVENDTAFDRIGIDVSSAAASSTVRLGIYADNGSGTPSSVLLDAGTVSTTTTGGKEISTTFTLTRGRYWLAAKAEGGTPSLRSPGTMVQALGSSALASPSFGQCWIITGAATGALPTWSGGSISSGNAPAVMLRKA